MRRLQKLSVLLAEFYNFYGTSFLEHCPKEHHIKIVTIKS